MATIACCACSGSSGCRPLGLGDSPAISVGESRTVTINGTEAGAALDFAHISWTTSDPIPPPFAGRPVTATATYVRESSSGVGAVAKVVLADGTALAFTPTGGDCVTR